MEFEIDEKLVADLMEKYTITTPPEYETDEHLVYLKIDNQRLRIGLSYDDRTHADWMRRQIAIALSKFLIIEKS